MPEYLAPGVFVEETSFRAKTIEGVSTTTTGFVAPAASGPVTLAPDIVTSLAEFEQTYGGGKPLVFDSSLVVTNHLWQAVRAFFSEGGKRLYVSRVFKPLKKVLVAGGEASDWEYAPLRRDQEFEARPDSGKYPDGHARACTADGSILVRSRHPGAAGNLRVRFTLKAGRNILSADADKKPLLGALNHHDLVWIRDAARSVAAPGPVGGAPEVTETTPAAMEAATGIEEAALERAETTPEALAASAGAIPSAGEGDRRGSLYVAEWDETARTWMFAKDGARRSIDELVAEYDPEQGDTVRVVTLSVTLLTLDGGAELAGWSGLPLHPAHQTGGQADSLFARFPTDPATAADARNLPLVVCAKPGIGSATAAVASLFPADEEKAKSLDPLDLADPSASEAARGTTIADKFSRGVSVDLVLAGGNDGQVPGPAEYEGKADPARGWSTGLKQLEEIEDISIVAAPGSTFNHTTRPVDVQAISSLLIAHAERMRYRVAVLDGPPDMTISAIRDFRARLDSRHAALYHPWVKVSDPISREPIDLPPSGFVAGIYARNDVERGVWKAPANEVVRLAVGFESNISKAQQEVLNPEGINCFRFFEGRGNRLWGARTISSDPEWKYVNVRRYFAYLERSIDKGTQWAVFEPNGDLLWSNVRRTIQDFLLNEWQSGALLGDKPEKAFFVRCDRSTMTQNDLDNGRLIALVGVAPVKPAEFVVFRVGQWTADSRS